MIGQAISAQTAAGRDLNEARDSAAVSGAAELPVQMRATAAAPAAKSMPASAARPAAQNLSTAAEAEPTKPAAPRTPAERVPATKARPTGREANVGSDMRQLRNGGAMRIDTEDPYK